VSSVPIPGCSAGFYGFSLQLLRAQALAAAESKAAPGKCCGCCDHHRKGVGARGERRAPTL